MMSQVCYSLTLVFAVTVVLVNDFFVIDDFIVPFVILLQVAQYINYRKVSNIRRTKSQNLNASRLIW